MISRKSLYGLLAAVSTIALYAAPSVAQRAADSTGVLVGQVVDTSSRPVSNVTISIDSNPASVKSSTDGRFRLDAVAAGDHLLWARMMGVAPQAFHVTTIPRGVKSVRIILATPSVVLPTVTTTSVGLYGKPGYLAHTMKYDGFYERRHNSSAGGRFYTRDDLVHIDPHDLVDFLRRVPGLRLWDQNGTVVFRFPDCGETGTLIKVDGQTVWASSGPSVFGGSTSTSGDPLGLIGKMSLAQIEAVEVYPTSASLPAEAVGNACAAIFVWTR